MNYICEKYEALKNVIKKSKERMILNVNGIFLFIRTKDSINKVCSTYIFSKNKIDIFDCVHQIVKILKTLTFRHINVAPLTIILAILILIEPLTLEKTANSCWIC
ncbi:hypothetical protein V1478_000551 [Vespula squamosa]|uniref:Uncharacterized protein n=1 Tax=Vespula squamosa TaxID=30214 RepID=A0ABD2C6E7_VESSQ